MQKQLTANQTRVELLNNQNRRLSATIEKLGAHLKQQAGASGSGPSQSKNTADEIGGSGEPNAGKDAET